MSGGTLAHAGDTGAPVLGWQGPCDSVILGQVWETGRPYCHWIGNKFVYRAKGSARKLTAFSPWLQSDRDGGIGFGLPQFAAKLTDV